jgi:hypothetical protein
MRPVAEAPRNRTPPATASEQSINSSFGAGISSHQRQTVEPTSGRAGSPAAGSFAVGAKHCLARLHFSASLYEKSSLQGGQEELVASPAGVFSHQTDGDQEAFCP